MVEGVPRRRRSRLALLLLLPNSPCSRRPAADGFAVAGVMEVWPNMKVRRSGMEACLCVELLVWLVLVFFDRERVEVSGI